MSSAKRQETLQPQQGVVHTEAAGQGPASDRQTRPGIPNHSTESIQSCSDLAARVLEAFAAGDTLGVGAWASELSADCPDFLEFTFRGALDLEAWPESQDVLCCEFTAPWPPDETAPLLLSEFVFGGSAALTFEARWAQLGTERYARTISFLRCIPEDVLVGALRTVALRVRMPSERVALAFLIRTLPLRQMAKTLFWIFDHEDEESRVAATRGLVAVSDSSEDMLRDLIEIYLREDAAGDPEVKSWRVVSEVFAHILTAFTPEEAIPIAIMLIEATDSSVDRGTLGHLLRRAVQEGRLPVERYHAVITELWPNVQPISKLALLDPLYLTATTEVLDWLVQVYEDPTEAYIARCSALLALTRHESSVPQVFQAVEWAINNGNAIERQVFMPALTQSLWRRDHQRALGLLNQRLGRETDLSVLRVGVAQLGRWASEDPLVRTTLENLRLHPTEEVREVVSEALAEADEWRARREALYQLTEPGNPEGPR